ncbi:MAG: hypothetical protein CMO80_19090 [Verrucomicrobiales bacterium]|nr:hypothetical protein [Verrucomicrobiales bacterium]|tara:strand:- start:2413 stop:2721 length:309 start_codon:yes stop_codon:yes gene_type:complete
MLPSPFRSRAPKLAGWLEENLLEGFTVFDLPPDHRRRMRTSNPLEPVNKELKRLTRVAGIFPNEASLLRLLSARLMEFSKDWETAKIRLRMQNDEPTQKANT